MLTDIQTALDSKLASFGGEVAWEGVTYLPTVGTPYVAASVASRMASTYGIGPAAPRLWQGTYRLLVCSPANEGLGPAYATADALLALFARGTSLTSNGHAVTVESGSVSPSFSTADWINVPVTINWFAEEQQ